MNSQDILAMTNEAEVKAYLRKVKEQCGRLFLLRVAEQLSSMAAAVNERAMWCLEVLKDEPRAEWGWPYLRKSLNGDAEYACRDGVGHSSGVHGCDGCCADPAFPGIKR